MTYDALSEPFDAKFIDTVRKGNRSESYVNHAVVTDRLNRVAPGWSSELLHIESYHSSNGEPHVAGVTLRLTIDGVSRDEVGTVGRASNYGDEIKACMSDALKRAAMRFGVGIQLWHELPRAASTSPGVSATGAVESGMTPAPTLSGPDPDARTAPSAAKPSSVAPEEESDLGRSPSTSGGCSHELTSTKKLDGGDLPTGYLRCMDCQQLSDKHGRFK